MPTDYSAWLTKQQAADAIGVSTKTIEKLAQRKDLQQAFWKPGGAGANVAVYHPDDVERLRQERHPSAPAFVVPPADPTGNGSGAGALVGSPPVDQVLRALVAAVIRAASEKSENSSERLFLTLDEAAAVSGLPRSFVRRLIAEGKLEAFKARGWRIRRRDLEKL